MILTTAVHREIGANIYKKRFKKRKRQIRDNECKMTFFSFAVNKREKQGSSQRGSQTEYSMLTGMI
jgi:hypothetical protein